MKDKEWGFSICQSPKGLTKGPTVKGETHSVSVPLVCPPGSKVVGVHHHHPGGSLKLSEQDKKTARQKGLKFVCINSRAKRKCYRFK